MYKDYTFQSLNVYVCLKSDSAQICERILLYNVTYVHLNKDLRSKKGNFGIGVTLVIE